MERHGSSGFFASGIGFFECAGVIAENRSLDEVASPVSVLAFLGSRFVLVAWGKLDHGARENIEGLFDLGEFEPMPELLQVSTQHGEGKKDGDGLAARLKIRG
jgi:hypothetical protein